MLHYEGVFLFQFLCMDVSQDLNISNQVSPRRTIETIKSVSPGGTLVTTTTTTTKRPQNHRIDANVDSKILNFVIFLIVHLHLHCFSLHACGPSLIMLDTQGDESSRRNKVRI